MMIRFLGGVYFAAILIGLLAVVVALATFVEGHYDSHDAAVELVYNHPFFNILLGGFFLNILLSALRRYPFKKRHIPFIITHIGLLMIISGTMIKNSYGLQGTMTLFEGSESNRVKLSNARAIHIDGKSYDRFEFKTDEGLQVFLKGYIPHSTFRYSSWVKSNGIDILGFPRIKAKTKLFLFDEEYTVEHIKTPNPLNSAKEAYLEYLVSEVPYELNWSINPTINNIPLTGFYRHIDPRYFEPYTGVKPQLLKLKNQNRLLFFSNDQEVLICLIREDGSMHLQQFNPEKIDSYYAYGEGRGGYSIEASFPNDLFMSLDARLDHLFQEIDPNHLDIVRFLWDWQGEGTWLTDREIAFDNLSDFESFGQWSKALIPHVENSLIEGIDPFVTLGTLGWKKPQGFDLGNTLFEQLKAVQEQLFNNSANLPKLDLPVNTGTILSALCRSSGISFDQLWKQIKPIELGVKTLESPLGYVIESSNDLLKKPAIALEFFDGETREKICIPFESQLEWPIFNGKHLVSFESHVQEIPYKVRLKQARKLCNPSTNDPCAYEADVLVNGSPFTLKMNEVFESITGTRFYLSSLNDNAFDAKQVVIVINDDPVRYKVTYPGGVLVVLGAFLLFFRRKRL